MLNGADLSVKQSVSRNTDLLFANVHIIGAELLPQDEKEMEEMEEMKRCRATRYFMSDSPHPRAMRDL